ncbi:phospholipase B1, membrane-associated isoform X2 [Hemibagrus wyckioides]|uniref:phospholipase B1, membrane-associated isoform X2 n=1 Tax=Hemibagrus wyckioides TaxID=337641 RepID=UPI00266D3CDC|nr:phospholipase B1, membrane-associated isoform X2 [Hemibagrus wyckioides]
MAAGVFITSAHLLILAFLVSAHSDSSTDLALICPQTDSNPSPSLPSSVHSLRPADVCVLSALGLSTSHRSAEVKTLIRLSELLSSFNPKLSTLIPAQSSLMEEVEDVVQLLDHNQWKLLLLFVSVDELCVCSGQASSAVEEMVFRVEKALEKLQDKLDHTLVHVVVWGGRADERICECEEGVSADTRTWRRLERAAIMANIQDSLGALLLKHHQWTEGENFTVALQSSPTFLDSSDDSEEEGDSQTLRQLWSKLLHPLVPEVEVEGQGVAVSCPSQEKPYLFTQRNSAVQSERETYSADIQTNPMATSFPCTVTSSSPSVPTSVHFLRPADVKVVAALGDSLTAGNGVGAGQNNVLGVITEYRGLSWSIGGNGDLSSVTTLANILRAFNPSLTGFSTGTGKVTTAQAFLNQAVAGAESKDLPSHTRALITRMSSDSRIDFQNDWKVITLFIGGNDLCEHCANLDLYSAENFARNIRDALDILHREVPRVLVNLVELFNIAQLRQLHLDFKLGCPTWLVKSICPCVLNPAEGSSDLQALIDLNREYQTVTRNLVDSGRYNTRSDFTVVLQPFFRNVSFPLLPDGRPDRSFFAGDCFHLSQKSHTLMARALWNNMLEPLNSKTTSVDFNEGVAMKCPSESNPYFSTNENSALDFVATPMIANWGSDFSCTHTAPSDTVPASVHRLRPGDVNVVAALGDSITAGFGAKAKNLLQLPNEERGVSWSIGGDGILETVTTLPNILKKFNPNVFGFSRGRSKRPNGFNMAVSGAKAVDIPGQVRDLVEALKNNTSVDFEQDWKMVTLFIGGNDLCQYCQNPASLSPKKYIGYIKEAMDILYHEVPRVLVNFVELLQIENLRKIKSDTPGCTILQPTLCPCFLRPEENSAELFEMKRINRQMQTETERLVFGGRYESREDFALVLQPFFQSTVVPMGEDRQPDLSFFSVDCFHFTERGHAEIAIALWNNMLEPVGSKQTYNNFTHDRSKIHCPSETHPFIFTRVNSFTSEPLDPTDHSPSPISPQGSVALWVAVLLTIAGALVGGVLSWFTLSCRAQRKRTSSENLSSVKIQGYESKF